MNIYEKCPVIENEVYQLRLVEIGDAEDLLEVYSDRFALPFFNSDNCNGCNFYCTNKVDMDNTIKYWLMEYHETKGFVRFSIIDKKKNKIIGTIEIFKRLANDYYNECGLLRLDLRSDEEKAETIEAILEVCLESFYKWFDCRKIATKAALYAVERREALKKLGFESCEEPLIGKHQSISYYDYWVKMQ